VESIGTQVQELILVINKADRTSDPERAAAAKFTREILEGGCIARWARSLR